MAESVLIDIIGRDRASAAFDSAARGATRAASKIDSVAGKMTRTGATMTRKITVPVIAAAAASADLAIKWQKSMTLLQTAGGETAGKVQVIGKGIQKTATDTGTSLSNLNEGMYIAAKADHKWKAVDQLKVLHAVAEGAKTENVDLGLAMTAQTSVMQSYGLGASKAVSVQNQLIKGAGLAKTTYAEYAASLSNVVPLASQLHISFAEVSGAIDTMTQHGDSAQRATDDLNNLIRNLAGQNNVASSAMQQLGINTVDLSKHLGQRGLTGTLAIVRKALEQHTKHGMIVTDVHKAAALATKSLNEEIGVMAPHLQSQSKDLLKGSTSIKDYTKYAKGLGGDSGAQALQFLALYKSSKGFNDQLRSGNGVVKTSAAAMLKLLGGSTAMNTALMLGVGHGKEAAASQKLFGQSVAEVAKAAKLGGTDVLGWAETSNTMAVKAGRAKAQLQVLGLEIGTALLPFLSKLAGEGSKAIHWLDGLSGSQKEIVAWTVGILAALGPVLTIGGRLATVGRGIGKFAQSAGSKIASLAGASEATATRVGNITRRMVSGVSGILVGAAAAQVGGNSSGGWLASIMLGTAGGWAVGGPVAAAVGGVSAAVFKGIGLWNDHKNAAKQAAAQEKVFVDSLTQAIQVDNGALGTNLKLSITKSLQSKGILDQAEKLGVSLADVVSASMGNRGALSRSIDKPAAALVARQNHDLAYLQSHPHITESQAGPINAEIQSLNKQIGAYGRLREAITGTSGDVRKASAQYKQEIHALDDSRFATGKLSSQLAALRNSSTVAIDANGQLSHSLSKSSLLGQHNRSTMVDLAAAALADANNTFAAAQKHHSYAKALDIAKGKLDGNISSLEKAAKKAGFNKGEVDKLITSLQLYGELHPAPTLHLNTGPAKDDLNAFIAGLPTVTVTARMKVLGGPKSSTYQSQVPGHAAGGKVGDGWFTVGEDGGPNGFELGHKSGSDVVLYSNRDAKRMLGVSRLPGYAKGSTKLKGDASTVGTAIGQIGVPYSPPFDLSQTRISRVTEQIKHAQAVLDEQIRKGLKASTIKHLRAEIADLRAQAQKQLAALRVKITHADTSALTKALKGSVDDARAAFGQMIADARAAGLSSAQVARISRAESTVLSKMRARDSIDARLGQASAAPTAYDKLQTARDDYSGARTSGSQAITSAFDITSAGLSGSVILGRLKSLVAKAKPFAAAIGKLAKAGLPPALLQQLEQAGPAALTEANGLLASGLGTIHEIASQYGQLNGAGSEAGKYVADAMYGSAVSSAQSYVNGLLSQKSAINKAITKIVGGTLSKLRDELHVASSAHGAHQSAAAHHKGSTSHGSGHSSGHAGKPHEPHHHSKGITIHELHVHDQHDPVAAANAVVRRLAHLGSP